MFENIKIIDSIEGTVAKFVHTGADAVAETVLYRYPTYAERTVICCSTMSGCPVGCRFCGAGNYFARSLTGDEIVYQIDEALAEVERREGTKPENIERLQLMFMSMGEPMLNPKGMKNALRRLAVKYPNAALLISTMGPKVDFEWLIDLSVEIPQIGLQFSIHESTNEKRNELIPFANKMTLSEIAHVGEEWAVATGRNPFFNYCAGADNSTDEDASRLLVYFDPTMWCSTISVVCESNEGMPSRSDYQVSLAADFSSKMVKRGYDVRVFDPAGQDDIGGGCGQLWFVQDWMTNNPDKVRKSCGHGRKHVGAPRAAEKG